MKRRLLPLILLALVAAALWSGCNDDENLVPRFTRVVSDPECGPAPLDVQFIGIVTGGDVQADPTGANQYLDVRWDFADGSTGSGSIVNHTYTEPGIYEVLVTVTDDDGDRSARLLTVTVDDDSLHVIGAPVDTTLTGALAWFDGTQTPAPTPGASNSGGTAAEQFVGTGLVFNEVELFNETTVADPDHGEFVPWVELYNTSDQTQDLHGWFLTDDPAVPDKWEVPFGSAGQVPPGGFLVIWLDGRDEGPTHAGFRPADGHAGDPADFVGALYLFDPEGVLQDRIALRFPAADVSLGRYPDGTAGGGVDLRATVRQCGFDPENPTYRPYDFTWITDDAFGSVLEGRMVRMTWDGDLGDRLITVRAYDTQLSVTRYDTVRVHVLPPDVTP